MSEEQRPNIVFITCDQLRADTLGCAGHPVVETPNIDQLANNGIRFTNAYSSVATCIAARAAMLTGMSQKSHGRVGYRDGITFRYEHTLPGELANAGYHTQGVGKMHFAPARNLCGFHNVVLHDGFLQFERDANKNYLRVDDYLPWLRSKVGEDADMIMHGVNSNSWIARPWHYDEALHPTTWATTQAIDFLRRRDTTKPFFLWLSYVRPHPPYDPPAVYYNEYINADLPAPIESEWSNDFGEMSTVDGVRGMLKPRALHRMRAAYYALITQIDHQIGRLYEYLKEHRVINNTYFVFTSDHGELLGDHNMCRKSYPYRGSVNVPFIVSPPRTVACERGGTCDEIVELRDVMPTILDGAGVPIPDSVDGVSLYPLAMQQPLQTREYIHGEHIVGYPDVSAHYIATKTYKYAWFAGTGQEQFFDLANDPDETRNLIDDPAQAENIAKLRGHLIEELTGREEGYTDGETLFTRTHEHINPAMSFVRENA